MPDEKKPELEPERLELVEQHGDLYSIGRGVANEKFKAELAKVYENIADVNTEAEARRVITMKFVVMPSADRGQAVIAINATSSLPASKPSGDVLYLGKLDGERVGMVMQPQFDPKLDPRQGVLSFERKQVNHE